MKALFLACMALVGAWAFAPAPAAAQNTTCQTRPTGDSTNACASTAFVNAAIGTTGSISIAAYGAKCDGATDDTTAIQNAWNAAAAARLNVNLSGVGAGKCVFSQITMPTPVQQSSGLMPPFASLLVGGGPNTVTLISTVTGSNCAITLNVTYNSYQTTGAFGGFTLKQTTAGQVGDGICLTNITKLDISNIFVYGFSVGLNAIDTIDLHVADSTFNTNSTHIFGSKSVNTNPNAWTINDTLFVASAQYAIELIHPAMVNILHNTFEGSGTNLGLSPATVLVDGLPVDGTFGVNVQGNYFEFDQNEAIAILALGGDTAQSSYNIANNLFIRNSNNETQMIALQNAATTANLMSVAITANSFLDTSPFSGTSPYISASNPTVASLNVFCMGNSYNNSGNMTAKCQKPGAGAMFSMDTNGVFGGVGTTPTVHVQTFCTGSGCTHTAGPYIPTTGLIYAIVECIGGGGGGGGAAGSATGFASGGGGGAGGYSRKMVSAATIGASQTVVLGAAGAAGAAGNNAGGSGGVTSLGAICASNGGLGGAGSPAGVGASGGQGAAGGSGDISFPGNSGAAGIGGAITTVNATSALGGASYLGGVAQPGVVNGAAFTGGTGASPGAGGNGGVTHGTATSAAGGAGGVGWVSVTEFTSQ